MKEVMKSTAIGLGIALAIFCIIGVIFDIAFAGNFQMTDHSFTKMVVGCVLTGLAWGAPAAVYKNEKLSMGMKSLIHIGIGVIVQTVVAYFVGWIPKELGVGRCLLIVAGEIAFALIIWVCFYIANKKQAEKMNRRIQNM